MNHSQNLLSFCDLLSTLDMFDNSLKDLQWEIDQPKSAVAIIVKRSNINKQKYDHQAFVHDQILFLQRKQSLKDRHSSEICFPGGKQQKNQSLIQAAIRQTFEETNIKLRQESLLGCIDRKVNYIVSTKKQKAKNLNKDKIPQKQMVIYAFIFCIEQQQINPQIIKLSEDQMQSYKWVPAISLMKASNICLLDYTPRVKGVINFYRDNPDVTQNTQSSLDCISRALSPALQLKMNEKLFGVTLYILLIVLSGIQKKLQSFLNESALKDKHQELRNIICNLKEINERCSVNIILEVKKPITDRFRKFEKALVEGILQFRPRL